MLGSAGVSRGFGKSHAFTVNSGTLVPDVLLAEEEWRSSCRDAALRHETTLCRIA